LGELQHSYVKRIAKADKAYLSGVYVHITKIDTPAEACRHAKRNGGAPGIKETLMLVITEVPFRKTMSTRRLHIGSRYFRKALNFLECKQTYAAKLFPM
jgi:hypothetical protein